MSLKLHLKLYKSHYLSSFCNNFEQQKNGFKSIPFFLFLVCPQICSQTIPNIYSGKVYYKLRSWLIESASACLIKRASACLITECVSLFLQSATAIFITQCDRSGENIYRKSADRNEISSLFYPKNPFSE